MTQPLTEEQIDGFLTTVKAISDAYMDKHFPTLSRKAFHAEVGKRYVRIVCAGDERSVYCFLDLTNGDILKSASWKAPAKHARGNVNIPGFEKNLGPYGAAYLR